MQVAQNDVQVAHIDVKAELSAGWFFMTQPNPTREKLNPTRPNPRHTEDFRTRPDPTRKFPTQPDPTRETRQFSQPDPTRPATNCDVTAIFVLFAFAIII